MSSTNTFQERSYQQHSEYFKEYTQEGEKVAHAKTWIEEDTVDAWRHQRMYQALDPILAVEPEAKWLTVGDGRYGKDAHYITEKGSDALATDISEYLLKEAKDIGYITEYKVENAESLSFNDSEFDYVFCKESYHHFPRPMLALYEMLRVAKSGVLLIEPIDPFITERFSIILLRPIKNLIKVFLGKENRKHAFEGSGNYVYTLSKREVEKVALGLNYKTVAFKGITDAYVFGVEYEKMSDKGPLQKKVKRLINLKNILCKLGFLQYQKLVSIIFKREPSEELLQRLIEEGYQIIPLPDNPYISS